MLYDGEMDRNFLFPTCPLSLLTLYATLEYPSHPQFSKYLLIFAGPTKISLGSLYLPSSICPSAVFYLNDRDG